jgi:hypothetical protein
MPIAVQYPHDPALAVPWSLPARTLWGVAAQVRRQVMGGQAGFALTAEAMALSAPVATVNGTPITVVWDLAHAVHDACGTPVLGVCETDPELPGSALVSVNMQLTAGRPDVAASTAAHELGHVLFDVPAVLGATVRRYRSVTADQKTLLDLSSVACERRANEFMGALLAPPAPLHLRLLLHAHAERLQMVHAPHRGRQGSRVIGADNSHDAVSGVIAALASDFGVSERFIAVRLSRYRLIEGVSSA